MIRCPTFLLVFLLLFTAADVGAKELVMGMSKKTYDAITQVQELMDAEAYPEALEQLSILRERKLNSYERAHALNMTGFIYYQMERLDEALVIYSEALELPDLPDSQVRALLSTISQLALVTEDYKAAEKYALQLLASPGKAPPPPVSHVILAQAYIGQEQWDKAVEPLKTAMQMQRDAGQKPRENWMGMLSAAYYNLSDFDSMRSVLYELLSLYPREQYLMNLAALHGQLGETDKQLALVESLLDDKRLERSHHLLSLANLFMAHSLPYKAGQLLQAEMEAGRIESTQQNLELQSQAWYLAGEERKAIAPLEAAAAIASTGKLYMRVARLYMDIYDWSGAQKAADAAIEKGGLEDPGSAWLLRGMALARQDKLEPAREAFLLAVEHEESEKWALQWLKFVANEQRRIAAMQI
jgi:tetratricopeptide (TPR) repeat protein